MSVPSKRMMASDGGSPGFAAGVITSGFFQGIPLRKSSANTVAVRTNVMKNAILKGIIENPLDRDVNDTSIIAKKRNNFKRLCPAT
jgi:hypothetical protein